jgi:non-heme chloroperoxidase
MMCGIKAAYDCIEQFSETDHSEDLRRFDVPTLILHGDDDQIVPIKASALPSAKLVKGVKLVLVPGAPHGLCSTEKERVNAELLAFFRA